jgi:hypothetical protein
MRRHSVILNRVFVYYRLTLKTQRALFAARHGAQHATFHYVQRFYSGKRGIFLEYSGETYCATFSCMANSV